MNKLGMLGLVACLSISLQGCAISLSKDDNKVHQLILGVGVVTTVKPKDAAVGFMHTKSFGLVVSGFPSFTANFGYLNQTSSVLGDDIEALVDFNSYTKELLIKTYQCAN